MLDGFARQVTRAAALAVLVCASAAAGGAEPPFRIPPNTRELVLVLTDDWNSTNAEITRWKRIQTNSNNPNNANSNNPNNSNSNDSNWRRDGAPVAATIGWAGLGWGAGLHPDSAAQIYGGPLKREGDGRSPAGAFRLREATGYAPAPPAGATLKYTAADARLRCVDDPRAREYNTLVEAPPDGGAPWSSAEIMRRDDALYTFTIVVEHNRAPIVAGRGSCVFLHLWSAPGSPSIGCTTLALDELRALLVWLAAADEPVLVQLPRAVYARVASAWGLPPPAARGSGASPAPRRAGPSRRPPLRRSSY